MPVQERPRTHTKWSLDLTDRVDRALRASGYMALRDVRVTAIDGVVYLEGRVSSYHLKQIAQETAMAVEGVELLQNDLVVG